jgi:superfamily I DNA and/or RNA helicase
MEAPDHMNTRLQCSLVAMTRPKRHLCVVGDSDTVSR